MLWPAKMRHCWNCGAEMGVIDDRCYERLDTCYKRSCRCAAQKQAKAEREAHERFDRARPDMRRMTQSDQPRITP